MISEFEIDGPMKCFLHVERWLEAGFLHPFGREDRLSAEFLHTDGADRICATGNECQKVEAIAANQAEPIGQ